MEPLPGLPHARREGRSIPLRRGDHGQSPRTGRRQISQQGAEGGDRPTVERKGVAAQGQGAYGPLLSVANRRSQAITILDVAAAVSLRSESMSLLLEPLGSPAPIRGALLPGQELVPLALIHEKYAPGRLGLKEDTILMVISDNGTGGKWTCYEGGVNTGCIMRWPGKLAKGKVSDAMIQNVDIAPTVFEMCGVKPAEEIRMHGVSQADHLLQGAPAPRDSVYLDIGYQRAVVRKDGMKYLAVRFPDELQKQVADGQELDLRGRKTTGRKVARANELYDIRKDPHERKNLIEKEETAKTRQELEALLSGYCKRLPHTFWEFTG